MLPVDLLMDRLAASMRRLSADGPSGRKHAPFIC
jgi:hypothetical protein